MNHKHSIEEKRGKVEILFLISKGINYVTLISQTKGKSKATISEHLSELESKGFIKNSKRKSMVIKEFSLTLKGCKLLDYISAMDKLNKKYLDVL